LHIAASHRLIAIAAALAAILVMPSAAGAQREPAHGAAEFRDSIGIGTHITYYDTAYGDWARIVDKLDELGIDHLRDGIYANSGSQWRDWNERYYRAVELAAAHGKRFVFSMGEPNYWGGTLDELIDVAGGRLRNAIALLEGPNEYDLFHPGENWDDEVRDYQRELYRRVKEHPTLRDLPVAGPSIVFRDNEVRLGKLDDALDLGNIHPYSGGEPPGPTTRFKRNDVRDISGDKPVIVTETGYHNAMAAREGQPPVSEDVGASYLLRTYLENFRDGVGRTYAYEFIDERPDVGLLDPEQHFGLLRNDFSEKPAFSGLKLMLARLGRPGRVETGAIELGFTGDMTGVQRLLLQESNRRFILLLWQTASEWDQQRRLPRGVPERDVTVELPGEANVTVTRFARQRGSSGRGNSRRVALSLPADPIMVELDFATPPPGAEGTTVPPGAESPLPGVTVPGAVECRRPKLKGGLALTRPGTDARFLSRRSRRNTVRVEVCVARSGRATVELVTRAKRPRALARRKLTLKAGRRVTRDLRWKGRAKHRRLTARVRYRQTGAKRDRILKGRLVLAR
jgi:hypothetical protein